MTGAAPQLASGAAPAAARDPAGRGQVGPNAILQLGHALRARYGEAVARGVYAAAGVPALLDDPPQAMVDERQAAALYEALQAQLPQLAASAVATDAGTRTADYLLAHRIPRPVHGLLRALPAALAARLLLRAVSAHAWTFAGSGAFRARPGTPHVVEIAANPLCMPGCAWHVAVFERLFRALVTPRARVRHPICCHAGASVCRFEIAHRHLEAAPSAVEGAP